MFNSVFVPDLQVGDSVKIEIKEDGSFEAQVSQLGITFNLFLYKNNKQCKGKVNIPLRDWSTGKIKKDQVYDIEGTKQ